MTQITNNDMSLLRIGTVSAVRASGVEITVDADKNEPSILYKGDIIDNVTIGKYVVIHRGFRKLVVRVEEEYLTEDRQWRDDEYHRDEDRYTRTLRAILQGELIDGTFERGRTIVPMIGNTAYIATKQQIDDVYGSGDPSPDGPTNTPTPPTLEIGSLNSDPSIRFRLNIGRFFASHIGIFGNTGSGKSYTLTQLYTQLFSQLDTQLKTKQIGQNTQFIIFDLNGEYSGRSAGQVFCDSASKTVYIPKPSTESSSTTGAHSKINLPKETLNEPEFWYTLLEATEKTQRPFIDRALQHRYNPASLDSDFQYIATEILSRIGAHDLDTALVRGMLRDICKLYELPDVITNDLLEPFLEQLEYHTLKNCFYFKKHPYRTVANSEPRSSIFPNEPEFSKIINTLFTLISHCKTTQTPSPLEVIHTRFLYRFYSEVAEGFNNTTFLRPLIARIRQRLRTLNQCFEFTHTGHHFKTPIAIINLRYCSIEERKLIPLIVTRSAYKDHKINNHSNSFLNIIIDEAHNLLSYESSQESETWRNTRLEMFEEILKEGRKFGVFVTLASQRPHDISATITSQLHHYLLHQLVNPKDIDAVRRAVSYLDATSFDELSSLPRGTCIISGTSVQIPAVVKIDELKKERRPSNETINLVKLWGLDSGPAGEGDSDSSVSTSARAESAADSDSTRASDT